MFIVWYLTMYTYIHHTHTNGKIGKPYVAADWYYSTVSRPTDRPNSVRIYKRYLIQFQLCGWFHYWWFVFGRNQNPSHCEKETRAYLYTPLSTSLYIPIQLDRKNESDDRIGSRQAGRHSPKTENKEKIGQKKRNKTPYQRITYRQWGIIFMTSVTEPYLSKEISRNVPLLHQITATVTTK